LPRLERQLRRRLQRVEGNLLFFVETDEVFLAGGVEEGIW
jgi:hypothetical protein